jgi:hypothetical protein
MKFIGNHLSALNVGVTAFGDAVRTAGGATLQIEWAPPANGDAQAGRALAKLVNHPLVEAANREAYAAYLAAQPTLEGVGVAHGAIPGMGRRTILHAGPPIAWRDMCGPMQGAIVGAILWEKWAEDEAGARKLAESGAIEFDPCHERGAVGPMAGVISPSMPVWVVRDAERGAFAFSNFNEGLGKALRFGANGPAVMKRLDWMAGSLSKTLALALEINGPIELKPLMAQALHMGDELHNRNGAATSLLLKRLAPAMLRSKADRSDVAEAIAFMAGNDHFFLNISMAACKAMTDAAHGREHSSLVTAMARNGVDFGVRVSGGGGRWFTAPAPVVDGLYFPGYSIKDAAPDLGDSAITETAGLGGFAMAAAPAIVNFVGGTVDDSIGYSVEMGAITLGRNSALTLPAMGFAGTSAGIDARRVVDSGVCPIINTGIAHKQAGVGQIGAGVTRAPLEAFAAAVSTLAEHLPGA